MAASDIGGYLPVKFPLDGGGLASQLRAPIANRPSPNVFPPPPAGGALSPGAVDALVDAIPWQVKTRLLAEHESQWRRRERATVGHMQRQHGAMLAGLHGEIERLQATCRRLGAAAVWPAPDQAQPPPDGEAEAEATRQALADRVEQLSAEGRSKDDAVLALGRRVELQQEHYERELRERNEKVLRCKKDVALKDAYIARLLAQIKNYQSAQAASAPTAGDRREPPAPAVGEQPDGEHGGRQGEREEEEAAAAGLRVRGTHVQPSARQQRLRRGMSLGAYTMPPMQHGWGAAAGGNNTVCTSSSAVSAARHLPRTSTTASFLPPIVGEQQRQNSVEKAGAQQQHFHRAGFHRLSGKLRADAKSGDAFWIRKDQAEGK